MVTYTVHEREGETGSVAGRADKIVFVKEGFAWVALLFPILWLLYHRMWLMLAGVIALMAAIQTGLAMSDLGDDVAAWATFVVSCVFALLANDLRRWTLGMRGYRLLEPVSGRDLAECEERFFTEWLAAQGAREDELPKAVKRVVSKSLNVENAEEDDVIGLFPEPGK